MSFSGIAKPNLPTGHLGQGLINIMKSIYDKVKLLPLVLKFNIFQGVSLTYAQT